LGCREPGADACRELSRDYGVCHAWFVVDYPRVAWDEDAYQDLVQRTCFICEVLAGNPEYPHHVAYRNDDAIVFLNRFPAMVGQLLVAPVQHKEHVVGDFDVAEYVALQRVIHAAGRGLSTLVPTERLYVCSLGSQQANRHVHWHLTALPPGVPYEEQQLVALSATDRGYVDVPAEVMADLARRLGDWLTSTLGPGQVS
jgi:diadenosine tetraphosphate (Ap4A) HIT family hydrolase